MFCGRCHEAIVRRGFGELALQLASCSIDTHHRRCWQVQMMRESEPSLLNKVEVSLVAELFKSGYPTVGPFWL